MNNIYDINEKRNEKETPISSINDLTNVIDQFNAHNIDPNRPFTGQAHTVQGERGMTEVNGIRLRDIADCIAIGLINSTLNMDLREKIDNKTLTYNDLFTLDFNKIDPVALIQSACYQIEHAMKSKGDVK